MAEQLVFRGPLPPPMNPASVASFAVFLLAASLSITSFAGPSDDANAAYSSGDYVTALRLWRDLAEKGDASAQTNIGKMYLNGRGVGKDEAEAVRWYRKAAEQGLARAQNNLGLSYRDARGVPQDYAEALAWFRRAADQGFVEAQNNVGVMYRHGWGISQDDAQAAQWFRRAADQGSAYGEVNLGYMYQHGLGGLPRDDEKAVELYRRSAGKGNALGQLDLGVMYKEGLGGLPRDDKQAVAWLRKAADQGNAKAKTLLGDFDSGDLALKSPSATSLPSSSEDADVANKQGRSSVNAAPDSVATKAGTCKLVLIEEWPVRLASNELHIDGAINNEKIGVLLDTGAMKTLILRAAARRLHLDTRSVPGARVVGVGGESDVEVAEPQEISLGQVVHKGWPMLVTGAHDFGANIALILGEDFFQHVDVEFDLAHNALRLFQPRDCDGVPLAYWTSGAFGEAEIETLNEAQPQIVLQVKINGESLDALLDSGASASMLSSGTAARLGVTTQTPGVVAIGSSIGIGSTTVAVYGASFQSFAIGNETIRDAMILFANTGTDSSHTSAGSIIRYTMGQRTGMILGVDFLKAHRVLVAHSRRKIYFTYNGGPVFEKKWAPSSAHSQ